jgi:acyl-coenzyme A thioesterase PaaI-like protein
MTAQPSDTPARFSTTTAVSPLEPGRFSAAVDPRWTILGKPNGGYLVAIVARAAVASSAFDDVVALNASYLHSPGPGPVVVEVDLLRSGRSVDRFRARLVQDGVVCVEAQVTTGRFAADVSSWESDWLPRPEIDAATTVRIPGRAPGGARIAIMDEVDLRLTPETAGFITGRPNGRGELVGTLELPDGEDFDTISMTYAVDAFPPATFDVGESGWVPTIDLACHVRAIPAPGPLTIRHRAQVIAHERVDEVTSVWDSRGVLVGQGTQLAAIRFAGGDAATARMGS